MKVQEPPRRGPKPRAPKPPLVKAPVPPGEKRRTSNLTRAVGAGTLAGTVIGARSGHAKAKGSKAANEALSAGHKTAAEIDEAKKAAGKRGLGRKAKKRLGDLPKRLFRAKHAIKGGVKGAAIGAAAGAAAYAAPGAVRLAMGLPPKRKDER